MRLCDICDCKELCEKIAEYGASGMPCAEIRRLVEEIIEKNCEGEDYE